MGGLGSLGVGIAGLAGAFDKDVPNAPTRSVLGEGQQTLGALEQLLPRQASLYGATRPAYTQADLAALGQALPALLQAYQGQVQPAAGAAAGTQLGQQVGLMGTYGSRYLAAAQAADPRQAALMNTLSDQRLADLQSGGLSPFEQRSYQQAVRGGQAARGLGGGQSDAAMEGAYLASMANQRRQQYQGAAQQQVGLHEMIYGQPFNAAVGGAMNTGNNLASGVFQAGYGLANANRGVADLANPFNPYAQDIYNSLFNAAHAERIGAINHNDAVQAASVKNVAEGGNEIAGNKAFASL